MSKQNQKPNLLKLIISLIAALVIICTQGFDAFLDLLIPEPSPEETAPYISLDAVPAYDGTPYVVIDSNVPGFTSENLTYEAFEAFAQLDDLGRCGTTYANVCQELMPSEERGDISSVYPSGWNNRPYDFVDGTYLYNRCHLIGFQLTGENANERNLVTGTRYMNVDGMLPFENMVADHVREEDHHVLYRVTPIFEGENLVCDGVQMEALCVECAETVDTDDDFMFHVFCYNVQPGVEIDYATGENWEAQIEYTGTEYDYILNTTSKKFHTAECPNGVEMVGPNRSDVTCTRQELIDKGYTPAGCCDP